MAQAFDLVPDNLSYLALVRQSKSSLVTLIALGRFRDSLLLAPLTRQDRNT